MTELPSLIELARRRVGVLRWDVFWHEIRAREFRVALVVLLLPDGWSLSRGR